MALHDEFGKTLVEELTYILDNAEYFDLPYRVEEAIRESVYYLSATSSARQRDQRPEPV